MDTITAICDFLQSKSSFFAFTKLTTALASITTLNLSCKNIGDVGTEALAAALKNNRTITTLDLSFNKIGDSGAIALATALSQNATITTLNLDANNIGQVGAEALAALLRHNSTIITMSLSVNDIGLDGAKALQNALKHNSTITILNHKYFEIQHGKCQIPEKKEFEQTKGFGVALKPQDLTSYERLHFYGSACKEIDQKIEPLIERIKEIDSAISLNEQQSKEKIEQKQVSTKELQDIIKKKGEIEENLKRIGQEESELLNNKRNLVFESEKTKKAVDTIVAQKKKAEEYLFKAKQDFEEFQSLLRKPIANFSVDDVGNLLQKIRLSNLVSDFRANGINGEVFEDLDEAIMKSELGLTVLERKKLLRIRSTIQSGKGYDIENELNNWTKDRVSEWLISKGFSNDVIDALYRAEITGQVLTYLNETDLKELNILSLGDRLKLKKEIASFAKEYDPNNNNNNKLTSKLEQLEEDYISHQTEYLRQLQELQTANDALMSNLKKQKVEIPQEFLCPITCEVMQDPVLTSDGHVYEKLAIQEWFGRGKTTSPLTNKPLYDLRLTPVHALRSAIKTFLNKNHTS